ncbi:MAG: virulence factor SrfB, partial [Succinivibrio sp.]
APLSALCALCTLYKPDLLILTGRPSRIPGLREFFLERVGMPSSRVILLSEYECSSSWYPLATNGLKIGDTKATVAMGAAIACMKSATRSISNFRFDLKMPAVPNNIRYLGHIDSRDLVSSPVCRFATLGEIVAASGENEDFQPGFIPQDRELEPRLLQEPTFEYEADDKAKGEAVFRDQHVLPDCLGFRQFKSSNDPKAPENYPATPLFNVDVITGPEEVRRVRKMSSLSFFDERDMDALLDQERSPLETVQMEECRALKAEHDQKAGLIDSGEDPQVKEFAAQTDAQRRAQADSQAAQELEPQRPKGLLAGMKMNGFNAKVKARADELYASFEQTAAGLLAQKKEELKAAERDRYMTQVRTKLNEWYTATLKDAMSGFDYVQSLNQDQKSFEVRFRVESRKEPPVERLSPLWKEISNADNRRNSLGGVPSLMLPKLKEVKYNGRNVMDYVTLQVKTVNQNGEQYWNDTGLVYIASASAR